MSHSFPVVFVHHVLQITRLIMILIIPKVIIILISILIIILILIYLIYISFIVEVIWCCIYPWFYCFSCFLVLLCFLDRCLLLRWYFPTFQEMLLSSLSSSVQFSFSLNFFKVNITFSFCSSFASFNFYSSFFIHSAFLPLPFSEILHFFFLYCSCCSELFPWTGLICTFFNASFVIFIIQLFIFLALFPPPFLLFCSISFQLKTFRFFE